SVRQVEQVLGLIHRLKEQGVAVMLISHRMPDVFAVCDRVVVMRRGETRADKSIRDTSPEEVTALITGAKEAARWLCPWNPRSPSPMSAVSGGGSAASLRPKPATFCWRCWF